MDMIYLDYSSTTPVAEEVLEEMLPYFSEKFGNPSNLHTLGIEAKKALDKARERLAELVNCSPEEVVFTSSGTEANNLAIKGYALANMHRGRHIIISAVEHLSVQHPALSLMRQGFRITRLKVDEHGSVSPEDVENAIKDDTILIAIQHANHEIGTVQEIEKIGEIAEEREIALHVDATASAGNYPVDFENFNAGMLSLSGHRFYAPKGSGALVVARGTRIAPLLEGGIQEKGMRAGTEAVAILVGLGKACEIARRDMSNMLKKYSDLRKILIEGLEKLGAKINGHPERVLPSYVHASFSGVDAEFLSRKLQENGIIVSSGSPCMGVSAKQSHVLEAIKLGRELARGSLLFSMGRYTEKEHIQKTLQSLDEILKNNNK